ADSSRNPRIPTFGLVMISTAPISRARMAASVLGPVSSEQMTTGTGFWDMTFSRNVRPSILGISRSRRMTLGGNFFILSMAMKGSAGTLTENPRYSESTDPSTWRTMAESSTTRTFKTPESPGALAVRVSAKSRCLSELTFFPIHETRRRTATARGIASKPLSRELYDRGAAECTEPHRGPWDSSVTVTRSAQRTVTCRRRHRGFPHVRGTDIQ